jgi:hypothetical protein
MFLKVTVKVSISRFSGLYYSSDGGTSWKNSDATLNTIRFINTAIAAGQNKMIRKKNTLLLMCSIRVFYVL